MSLHYENSTKCVGLVHIWNNYHLMESNLFLLWYSWKQSKCGVKHHQTNKYTLYNIIIQIRPSLIPTFRPGRFSILKNSLKSNKLFVCGDGTCKLSELPDSSGELDSFVSRLPFLSFTSATSEIEKMQFYLVSLYTSY